MTLRVLITGMTGFIGHHVADHLLETTDWQLVGLDRIDATATLHRLRYVKDWPDKSSRVSFVWHDLKAEINASVDRQIGDVDVVLHLAASTHIDRSIIEPLSFVLDNVVGTANLLEWWRNRQVDPLDFFVQFGTDEIFGPAPPGVAYKEWDRYCSTNPYSAAKAGAEELACAYSNTYKLKIAATHTMNVIGERQHPEKFIPMTIRKVRDGETVIIHADHTGQASGSRFYIHAKNVGRMLKWLIEREAFISTNASPLFDKWNIVGEREVTNLEMAQMIAQIVGKPLHYELVDFHSSRPGHDPRYALDGSKLENAGFHYPTRLEEDLEKTVKWFLANPTWLEG